MNKATLLHRMCNDDLTQADINAIGKSRGLSRTEIANRITFENFYLSPVGVEQAMATLTGDHPKAGAKQPTVVLPILYQP